MAKQTKNKKPSKRWRQLSISTWTAPSRVRRLRRLKRNNRSSNFWFKVDTLTYNKITLRDVERIWLNTFQPETLITKVRIPKCETMNRFKRGIWDGTAFQLKFKNETTAISFRNNWWNKKIT